MTVRLAYANLLRKIFALFGSYGRGNGEWMQTWEDDCKSIGADLVCDSVICNGAPDDEAIAKCEELGNAGIILYEQFKFRLKLLQMFLTVVEDIWNRLNLVQK